MFPVSELLQVNESMDEKDSMHSVEGIHPSLSRWEMEWNQPLQTTKMASFQLFIFPINLFSFITY